MNRLARTQAQPTTFLAAGLALLALSLMPAGAQAPAAPAKPPGAGSIIITNGPSGETGKVRLNAPYLSSGISDIVRMFQAGVEEPVILAFIQSSTVAYHPSAREVIYLRDLGLPQSLLTAMLKRGGDLRDRAAEEERIRAAQPAPTPPAPSAPTAAAPAASAAHAPAVVYTSTTPTYVAAPTYVASSPAYVGYPGYSYAAYSAPAYNACYPSYGGYYRPSYFSYGSCGSRFGVGFGYGGYYGGYRGSCGYGYGGYGYRGYGGYGYRGYGGIRYAGSYGCR